MLPGLKALINLKPTGLRADLIAGLTLAAYIVPSSIGTATLANLPPEAGMYACLFAGFVSGFFCSSRHDQCHLRHF
jgi:MFS superfamily sulfate permease-like transporter